MILKQYSILLSILTSGLLVNGQNREWSLQECIDYGVEKSLSMQQRELQNKNDKLDVRDATLSLLPSVSGISPGVNYSFGRGIDPETNTYTNTRYMSVGGFGVGSSLTVFAGFSNINRLRAAKLSRLMGWEETENQANQIAIQVMNAFFTLLYAEEEVRITQEQVENSRLRLKKIEREYELGKKPKSDLFEMQAQQASVEFRLITAQNNCLNAQANLKYIMNYNAEEELKIDARSVSEVHPELHELKTKEIFTQALQTLPEIKLAAYQIRSAQLGVYSARAGLYPSISISGSISFGNYSDQRWKDAAEAGAAFFTELQKRHEYELIQPTEETHRARRLAYRQAYYNRGGTEILISTRQGYSSDVHSSFIGQRYYSGPTLNYVDMFPWEDGTDFPANFDWKSPSKQPFFTKGEMVPTRDPRLYENVACPGDTYCNGTTAPVYINHADYKDGSGFLIMKYILQENNDREGPVQWSHTRLAEIMLGYAEVLNEVNGRPTDEAYKMVNDVRKRVGLPELSKTMNHDQFLEAVLRERALELGFEEVRWFDLVRRDRQSDFKKKLYGLRSRGNDLNNPTEFTFEKIELGDHYWATNWDTKWYLAPIPQEEINKQYGMTQNPGW